MIISTINSTQKQQTSANANTQPCAEARLLTYCASKSVLVSWLWATNYKTK